jgi:hypothetical protein
LPSSAAPVQFRLDANTRQRGLHHIAEIRRQMADRQAARSASAELPLRRPARRDHPTAA